jgi:hypothetical protein
MAWICNGTPASSSITSTPGSGPAGAAVSVVVPVAALALAALTARATVVDRSSFDQGLLTKRKISPSLMEPIIALRSEYPVSRIRIAFGFSSRAARSNSIPLMPGMR